SFFIGIAGSSISSPVMLSLVSLGPDFTFARLRHALVFVGAPSNLEVFFWV
ncbi:hypothetical protein, partial [Acinetobacter baumannii]